MPGPEFNNDLLLYDVNVFWANLYILLSLEKMNELN